jgi:calcium-dependent protein kinase
MKGSTTKERNALIKEYKVLRGLDHPNIAKLYDIYHDPTFDSYMITTQKINGFNLMQKLLVNRYIGVHDSVKYILSMIYAVSFMHSNGILVKRLTPSNLIVQLTGSLETLILLNFTLGRFFPSNSKMLPPTDNALFDAPEVHKSKKYSTKSDIWSIGMVSFLLLTGKAPYSLIKGQDIRKTVIDTVIDNNLLCQHPTIAQHPKVIDFLQSCLNYNAGDRPSIMELQNCEWFKNATIVKIPETLKTDISDAISDFYNANSFEKAMFKFIINTAELSDKQKKLKELFYALDITKNGRISKEELWNGLKKNKIRINICSKKQFMEAFDSLDIDKSGAVTFSEFMAICIKKDDLVTEKNLKDAFQLMDKDKSGFLTMDEIKNVPQAQEVFLIMDVNKDNKISIIEFINYFKNKFESD